VSERDREQAEAGRVVAEGERENGETRRQDARHKMYRRVSTLVALPIAFIVLVPLAVGIYFVNNRAVDAERSARIVAATASRVIQERAYGAQLKSCGRGNVLRRQMGVNNRVLLDVVLTAAAASMEKYKQYLASGDTAQADINLEASKAYTQSAKALKKIPPVDCLSVIPKP